MRALATISPGSTCGPGSSVGWVSWNVTVTPNGPTVMEKPSAKKSGMSATVVSNGRNGRGGGIRTHDLVLPKHVRYQATLLPVGLSTNIARAPCLSLVGRPFIALIAYAASVSPSTAGEGSMQTVTTNAVHHTATSELDDLIASWRRHLVAQRMSQATLSTYSTSTHQLSAFLIGRGMPTSPAAINREHVEAFITDLLQRWKPTTAHNRYRALSSFFRWLVDEGEIRESPMARMRPPRLPETPPPVLRETDL